MTNTVAINDFALRQRKDTFVGTQLTEEQLIAALEVAQAEMGRNPWIRVQNGGVNQNVDFCKVVSVHASRLPQVLSTMKCPIALITPTTRHKLITKYEARREFETPTGSVRSFYEELPVLVRHFQKGDVDIELLDVHHFDIILYSQEQVQKEFDSNECPHPPTSSDWDLIAVNAELEVSAPITPNTILRNALGLEYGGNGKALDRGAYMKAVDFWSKHAFVG